MIIAKPKELSPSMGGHALVIGGSMAGLLAGRTLAHRFERVTIIERDRYPEGPEPRKGVPQARHLHVLLARGRVALERLFPGFRVRGVEGGSPDQATRMMHRYMDGVVSLSTENAEVRLALLEAFNLSKPPATLFHPSILARVLLQAISRRPVVGETAIGRELAEAASGS